MSHADQVALRGEGIGPTSRVFFIDSSLRVSSHMLESDVPSVNFRGLMDPVCHEQQQRSLVNVHLMLLWYPYTSVLTQYMLRRGRGQSPVIVIFRNMCISIA